MLKLRARALFGALAAGWATLAVGLAWGYAQDQEKGKAQDQNEPAKAAAPAVEPLPGPPPLPQVSLGPMLPTTPVRKGALKYNWRFADSAVLPRDQKSIWVLDFAFKPMRIVDVDLPGKGRRKLHYMYYRVVNRSDKPLMFVPQFSLVTTDTNPPKRYEDKPIPEAVRVIQAREEPTVPLLGAVSVMGYIPPSSKEGVDDAVFGVAVWEGVDPKADGYRVFIRGLSDGMQMVTPPEGGNPVIRYKTLEIDFIRRGDEHDIHEREIELRDPPWEWIYW